MEEQNYHQQDEQRMTVRPTANKQRTRAYGLPVVDGRIALHWRRELTVNL